MVRLIIFLILSCLNSLAVSSSLKINELSDSYLNVTSMHLDENASRLAILSGNRVSIYDVDETSADLKVIAKGKLSEQIYSGNDILLKGNDIYITSNRGKFIWVEWDNAMASFEVKTVIDIQQENTECPCSMLMSSDNRFLYIVNAYRLDVFQISDGGKPNYSHGVSGPGSLPIVDIEISSKSGHFLFLTNDNYLVTNIIDSNDGELIEINSQRFERKIMSISHDSYYGTFYAISREEYNSETNSDSYIRSLFWDKDNKQYNLGLKYPVQHHYHNNLEVYKGNIYIQDDNYLRQLYHDKQSDQIIDLEQGYDFGVTLSEPNIVLAGKSVFVNSGVIGGIQSFLIDAEGSLENRGLLQSEEVGLSPVFADTALNSDGTRLYALTRNFFLQTYSRNPKNGSTKLLHETNDSLEHNIKADGERMVLDEVNNFIYLSLNDIIKVYKLDPEQLIPTLKNQYDLQLPIYLNSHDLYLSHEGERLYAVGSDVWKFKLDMSEGTILSLEAREMFNRADQMVFSQDDTFVYLMDKGDGFSGLIGGIFGYKQDPSSGAWEEVFALRNDFDNEAITMSSDEKFILAETDSGINVYSRELITGELTLENVLSSYKDSSDVERKFYDIFRFELLNNDEVLLVFSYDNVLQFERTGEFTYEYVDRLYLPSNVDEPSSTGGAYITVSGDQRYIYYSSVSPSASYLLSLSETDESSMEVVKQFDTQYITNTYYEKDVKPYINGSEELLFSANNLPPGIEISDDGVIAGQLKRSSLESLEYNSLIIVSDGISSLELGLTFLVDIENTSPEGESLNLEVPASGYLNYDFNLKDSESDKITMEITKYPSEGVVSVIDVNEGIIRYQSSDESSDGDLLEYIVRDLGSSSGVYNVTFTKEQQNLLPIANDDSVATDFETERVIDVLKNDTDEDGEIAKNTLTIVMQPQNGSLEATESGEAIYKPAQDFSGEDSFKYKVKDNDGDYSNEATVYITVKEKIVESEPDTPPNNDDGGGGSAPIWLLLLLLAYSGRRYYK